MVTGMREMKDSGIDWVGKIPKDWRVLRNKYNFDLSKNIVGAKWAETQLLSLTKNGVKAITPEEQSGKVPTSFATYQLVGKNDIVMCLFDLDVSAVFSGISCLDGMISPAYKCFKCKSHLLPGYADYYFRTVFVDRKYKRYSKNVRYSLGTDDFFALPMIVPCISDQYRIVAFLDAKCAEIDALSADIQSEIETLEAYKRSVITEAVTKGLDKNAPMKDSGISWIGKVPQNWPIYPLKYTFDFVAGATPDSSKADLWDGDVLWITPADYKTKDVYVSGGARNLSDLGFKSCSTHLLPIGTIVVSKRAPIGSAAITTAPLCTNQGCLGLIQKDKLTNGKYYYYVLSIYDEVLNLFGSGTTFKEISASVFGTVKVVNPSVAEQNAIVAYLDSKCAEIDSILAQKQEQLAVLADYKKSIIYEYVTGKKEVPVA